MIVQHNVRLMVNSYAPGCYVKLRLECEMQLKADVTSEVIRH